jgi:hypothetical protein
MFFHGTKMNKLHEHVSPDCLPEDYGGKLPAIDYGGNEWYPALLPAEKEIIGKYQTIKNKLFGIGLFIT